MTNFPAIRALAGIGLFWVLGCLRTSTSAQVLPLAPNFPTDARQCQSFSAEVEAYSTDYSRQHEQCLADNKADRQETTDSQVCSRSACQYLHDMLYADYLSISVKSERKEVAACYERVREYQTEEARKAKEKADEEDREKQDEADKEAREAKEEAEAKKQEADEEAKRKADRESAANKGADVGHDKSQAEEARAEAARIAVQQSQAYVQSQNSGQQTPRTSAQPGSHSSSGLVDPFKDSKSTKQQELASNAPLVDPFAPKESFVDPFSSPNGANAVEKKREEAWDGAKEIFQGFVDKATDNLADMRKVAKKQMSAVELTKFDQTFGHAHSYLEGFSKTVDAVTLTGDVKKVVDNPGDPKSYHDIISDGASKGFSYVLKRISPDFLSKISEGPAGWVAAITFDSSSTQTPKQDFDPMNVLNNPIQYNFQQRERALQSLYESAHGHPGIWSQSRYEWLYKVSERLYNSPDNPNIHLTPP